MNYIQFILLCLPYGITFLITNVKCLEVQDIIGGDDASIEQFPYIVSLRNEWFEHECGGGIIGDKFILTAAHCVIDTNGQFKNTLFSIVAGVTTIHEHSTPKEIKVEKIYVLKNYTTSIYKPQGPSSSKLIADIAILKLKYGLELQNSSNLKQLELPKSPPSLYVGEKAIVAGFGYNSITVGFNNETHQFYVKDAKQDNKLHYAETDVISNDECNRLYVGLHLDNNNLCARVKQRNRVYSESTCKGDSGGPLVYDNSIVIGVLSGNSLCKEDVVPSIYTRVSTFVEFIENVMKDNVTSDMRVKILKI